MGKCLPKVAAVSLCLLSLTGCVSRGEPGPAFPESYSPDEQSVGSQNPASGPRSPGMASAPQETGPWAGFVTAMTENPVSRTFKSAGQKTAETFTPAPRVDTPHDPTSLNTRSPKPGAAMFVSMAEVQQSQNNLEGAAETYERALREDHKHVPALLGLAQVRFRQQRHEDAYQLFTQARKIESNNLTAILGQAHFHDTRENMPEATRLYTEATQHHPESAAAWNDLGLCLARQRRLAESQQTLQKAVQIEPKNVLYRNNVATVLVELRRNDEALTHLQQAHGPAAGHYNLGFLLHRRGEDQAAAEQFSMALRVDPSFAAAQQWLDKINSGPAGSQRAGRPPLGRSAALLQGPDGRSISLFTKKASHSKEPIAPPEFQAPAMQAPVDVIVEDLASDEALADSDMQAMESTESPAQLFEPKDQVLPATAVEIADAEDSLPADSTPKRSPLRRVRVVRAYESETGVKSVSKTEPMEEQQAIEAAAEVTDEGDVTTDAPSPDDVMAEALIPQGFVLLQPQLVTGAREEPTSAPTAPATELESEFEASQLQPADEEKLQLESPPLAEAAADIQTEAEAYYADEPEQGDEFRTDSSSQEDVVGQPVAKAEQLGWKKLD